MNEKFIHLHNQALHLAFLGKSFLGLGLVFAIISIVAYQVALFRPTDARPRNIARVFYSLMAAMILSTFGLLISRVYSMDFRFEYVWEHTGLDLLENNFLHHWLRAAASWSGQEGSFLLWASWTCLIGFLVFAKAGKYENRVMPIFVTVPVFLCLILLRQTPFDVVPLPGHDMIAAGVSYPPLIGQGLNASLQNYWMTIHPPTIFFGFASLLVPFCYSVAALIWKDYERWTPRVMPYALLSCATLGIGLFMGGYWAYETQGWHGFWAWDPVENASFMPWLAVTALVHGLVVQKSRGGMGKTNTFLGILTFWLFILGTFLTRSGVLKDTSVHSFANIGKSGLVLMVVMLVFYLVVPIALWLWRLRGIPSRKTVGDSLVSRDFAFFMAVLLMMIACVLVSLGTTWPLIQSLTHQKLAAPEAVFYNNKMLPLSIMAALFMGVVPWLAWRKTDPEKFLTKLVVPWLVMLGFGFFMLIWSLSAERNLQASLDFTDANTMATLHAWHSPVVQRVAVVLLTSLGFLAALSNAMLAYRVFRTKPLAAGGWLAHVGIGVMMVGIIVSNTYERSKVITLMQGGESKEAFGYQFSFEKMTGSAPASRPLNPDWDRQNSLELRVTPPQGEQATSDGSAGTFLMHPRYFVNDFNNVQSESQLEHMTWPDIRKYWGHDLYVSLNDARAVWPSEDPTHQVEGFVFQPRQWREIGPYNIGFFEKFGTPGQEMGAHMVIRTPDGQTIEARPYIQMSEGTMINRGEAIPELKDSNGVPGCIILDGLSPETGAANLRISLPLLPAVWGTDATVTYKPWINLVWIGVLIAVLGTLIAMVRRAFEARSLNDYAPVLDGDPKLECWEMPIAPSASPIAISSVENQTRSVTTVDVKPDTPVAKPKPAGNAKRTKRGRSTA